MNIRDILAYSPPYGPNYIKDIGTIGTMADSGIRVMKLILCNSSSKLGFPYSPYPPIWRDEYDYDFSVIDNVIEDITKHAPDMRFICTLDLNTPTHWHRPEEADTFKNLTECFSTPDWVHMADTYLHALLDYLETHFSNRIVAWYLACGTTQEWFDYNIYNPLPHKVQGYEKWCKENSRELLPVPNKEDFDSPDDFGNCTMRHVLQWKHYVEHINASCVKHFLDNLRSWMKTPRPIGCVYGNIHGMGARGHLDCDWLYNNAHFDFYIGPSCNTVMQMGGAGGFQASQQKLKRFGIGYLLSCDRVLSTSSTELAPSIFLPDSGINSRQHNAQEDIACLKREFSISLVHGFGLWFFNIWGFAYVGAEVKALFPKFHELWNRYSGLSTGTEADVLLVYDTESDYLITEKSDVPNDLLRRQYLPQAHANFTTADFADLPHTNLNPYKVIIFPCIDKLTPERKQFLREHVCKDGRTIVFFHAPGIYDGTQNNPAFVQEVTGCQFQHKGYQQKTFPGWHSVLFSASGSFSVPTLHDILQDAGVHFYSEEDDTVIWASREILMLHTAHGGTKHIRLKRTVSCVTELFSGKIIATNADEFTDNLNAPDTRLYLLV